jgi:hypothetical protein
MNTSKRIARGFSPAALAVLTIFGVPQAIGADAPKESFVELTQTVFVGLDLSATIKGQPRRIVGMRGTKVELDVDGRTQRVESRELSGFVFQRGPKISPESIELTGAKLEPGFRPGGVVDQAWVQARDTGIMGQTVLDIAEGRADMDSQDPRVRNALQQLRLSGAPKDVMAEMARRNIQAGEALPSELEDEARRNRLFDAIDVNFLVSSPNSISDCYAAVVCTIRTTIGKMAAGQMVFFCDVGDVHPKARRVKTQFTGLPPGFQLLQTEFHFYSGTQELASNVAPNRVPLTAREAGEFLTAQYVSAHPGETTPARVAWAPRTTDALQRLAAKEKSLSIRFTIDTSGAVTGIADNSPTKALQEYIAAVRFFPALENGKAVSSTLSIGLPELFR